MTIDQINGFEPMINGTDTNVNTPFVRPRAVVPAPAGTTAPSIQPAAE